MARTNSKKGRKPGSAKTRTKHPFDNDAATEKALALQKAPRDENCMEAFYTALKPMIDRALLTKFAKGLDEHTRADLSQDILLKLMRKLGQFDPGKATLFNWATAVTRTMVIDYYRKNKREIPTEVMKDVPDDKSKVHLEVDLEVLAEMRAFFPFYVSTRVFHELFAIAERYRFKPNANMVTAIRQLFNKNDIDYKPYGTLQDYANFVVGLYRAWMVDDAEFAQEKLKEALENYTKVGPLLVLKNYLTPRQITTLLHICGGIQMKLPTPRAVLKDRPEPSR